MEITFSIPVQTASTRRFLRSKQSMHCILATMNQDSKDFKDKSPISLCQIVSWKGKIFSRCFSFTKKEELQIILSISRIFISRCNLTYLHSQIKISSRQRKFLMDLNLKKMLKNKLASLAVFSIKVTLAAIVTQIIAKDLRNSWVWKQVVECFLFRKWL